MSLTSVELIEHGTPQGYDAHKRLGEAACAACRHAHTLRATAHRIRRGEQQTVRVSVVELGELLIGSGEVFGHEIVAACMDFAAAVAWAERRSA
jgi:hypothetical protein